MKRTPLRKMGKDKARETAKYWPLRRRYLDNQVFCEFPDGYMSCCKPISSIHHMKGQNWRVMNDTRYWMGVCIEHHAWIEDNKREARKMGLILYK
jgi:hypothetical protein